VVPVATTYNVMVPSKYLSGGHTCTDKIVVFIMYTETHFVLCTGLQLQPTVYYVIIDCKNYKADSLFFQ